MILLRKETLQALGASVEHCSFFYRLSGLHGTTRTNAKYRYVGVLALYPRNYRVPTARACAHPITDRDRVRDAREKRASVSSCGSSHLRPTWHRTLRLKNFVRFENATTITESIERGAGSTASCHSSHTHLGGACCIHSARPSASAFLLGS